MSGQPVRSYTRVVVAIIIALAVISASLLFFHYYSTPASSTVSLPSSIPPCTNIAISTTITAIPCGGVSSNYAFVVDSIRLTAPSSSGKNGTLTLTLILRGDYLKNTTLSVYVNRTLIEHSAAIMLNGTHILQVPYIVHTPQECNPSSQCSPPSTVYLAAGQRLEIIFDELYSPGGPPPVGEPVTNELRVFLRAT